MTRVAPLVSVLLPVHNGMPYLPSALASLLSQTMEDFEIVAIDDRSTDGSLEHLRSIDDPRLRVLAGLRPGLVSVLNQAASESRGEYLARMDADDICLPDRLRLQCSFLKRNPGVGIVGSAVSIMDAHGVLRRKRQHSAISSASVQAALLQGKSADIIHPSVMIRQRIMKALGGYREYTVAEDRDLWLRASALCGIHNLPETLLKYRVHSAGVSRRRALTQYRSGIRLEINFRLSGMTGIDIYRERPALDACLATVLEEAITPELLRYFVLRLQLSESRFGRRYFELSSLLFKLGYCCAVDALRRNSKLRRPPFTTATARRLVNFVQTNNADLDQARIQVVAALTESEHSRA